MSWEGPESGPKRIGPGPREQFAQLGEHLAKLGEQFAQLGEQLAQLGEHLPQLGEQFAKLGEHLAQLAQQIFSKRFVKKLV